MRRRHAGSASLRMRVLFLLITFTVVFTSALTSRSLKESDAENQTSLNWAGNDYAPQIIPDGHYLIFQSDRAGPFENGNLWFSVNKNYRDRLGKSSWTPPLPLFFPMRGNATVSMLTMTSSSTLSDPEGAFTVNTDGFEGMASTLYKKGNPIEIFFTSIRGQKTKRAGYDGLNIYSSRFVNERWSDPEHLNIVNSHFDDRMPCISHDGKRLYFVSDRPGGYGGNDIWYAERDMETGSWAQPVNMGLEINTENNEISPGLSARGTILFFSSDRPGGFGNYDLYASRYEQNGWGNPLNLGVPYNSRHDDEYISITSDGLWSYFASDRRTQAAEGRFDLYRARVPDWLGEVVDVLFTGLVLDGRSMQPLGVNATIKVHFEKETLVSSSRFFVKPPETELFSNFEIKLSSGRSYRVEISAPGYEPVEMILDYDGNLPPDRIDFRTIVLNPVVHEDEIKVPVLISIDGQVVDKQTGKMIPFALVALEISGGAQRSLETDKEGRFKIQVPARSTFTVTGRAEGYEPETLRFVALPSLTNILIPLGKITSLVVDEDPCAENLRSCLDRVQIFFDVGSFRIDPSQFEKLNSVVKVMKMFPDEKIEILGHSDITYRGPKERAYDFNQKLSENRASAVRAELIKRGVPEKRLLYSGKSYLKPICSEPTPDCLRKNRRVEFRRKP